LYLKQMCPEQLKHATADSWPLLIPAGCIEYHGPHLPLGTDTLIAEALCGRVAAQMEAVVAPSFDYGATGYAVSGPELGTMDIDNAAFCLYAKSVLRGFCEMGFQRVAVIVHHQGSYGPLALALSKAAADLVFELGCEQRGRGWWGAEPGAECFPGLPRLDVFPSILPAARDVARGDHAGMYETSLMLAGQPDLVDMSKLGSDRLPWFCTRPENPSEQASAGLGEQMLQAMTAAFASELSGAKDD